MSVHMYGHGYGHSASLWQGYYMEGNFCLKCDADTQALASDFNWIIMVVFTGLMFFSPAFVVLSMEKTFCGVGTIVGAVGSLGDAGVSPVLRKVYMMLMMMNFDVQTLQPGCSVESSYFIEIWKQNMGFMTQFAAPAAIGLPLLLFGLIAKKALYTLWVKVRGLSHHLLHVSGGVPIEDEHDKSVIAMNGSAMNGNGVHHNGDGLDPLVSSVTASRSPRPILRSAQSADVSPRDGLDQLRAAPMRSWSAIRAAPQKLLSLTARDTSLRQLESAPARSDTMVRAETVHDLDEDDLNLLKAELSKQASVGTPLTAKRRRGAADFGSVGMEIAVKAAKDRQAHRVAHRHKLNVKRTVWTTDRFVCAAVCWMDMFYLTLLTKCFQARLHRP